MDAIASPKQSDARKLFDARQFRDVLGTFLTGVTVVTTRDASGVAHGVTVNSFSSVSLDPPLVLWSQAYTSKSFAAFRESDHFVINILAHDQVPLSVHFARSTEDKFVGIAHRDGLGGAPILDGAVAHLECVKEAAYPAGDHVLYIGRVEGFASSLKRPLGFGAGRYLLAHGHELDGARVRAGIEAAPAEIARVVAALPALSSRFGGRAVSLAVWGNYGPTIVHWEPGNFTGAGSMVTGEVVSLTQSATGLAFAAFSDAELIRPWLEEALRLQSDEGLEAAADDLATRRNDLGLRLTRVREDGYAGLGGSLSACVEAGAGGLMVVTLAGLDVEDGQSFLAALRGFTWQ